MGGYSDTSLRFLVSSVDLVNGPATGAAAGSATFGKFFGGTVTSAGDVSSLKNGTATANYDGSFRSNAGLADVATSADGVPGNNIVEPTGGLSGKKVP